MRLEIAVLIIVMAIAALFTRFASVFLLRRTGMPDALQRCLKWIPIGVFSALVASAIFSPKGVLNLSLYNPYLAAGVVTIFLAWRFRNFVVTVGIGTITMLLLRAGGL
ncbi:MAG: putative rane protein [Firmicutes bacterium]|nr:putative rane protein [Bacillota bacterium]